MADRRSAATKSAGQPASTTTKKEKAQEAVQRQQASKGLTQQQRAEQSESGGRYVDASGGISQIAGGYGYEAPRTIVVNLSDSVGVSATPVPPQSSPSSVFAIPVKTTYGGYGSASAQQAALQQALAEQEKMKKADPAYAARVLQATQTGAKQGTVKQGQRDLAAEQRAREETAVATIPFVTNQYSRGGEQIKKDSIEGQVIQRIIEEQNVARQANIIQQQRFANITNAPSADVAIDIIKSQKSPDVFFTFGRTGLANPELLGLKGEKGEKITGQVVVEREPTRGLLDTKEGQAKLSAILGATPRPSLQESLGYGIPFEAQPRQAEVTAQPTAQPTAKGQGVTTPFGGFGSQAQQQYALEEEIKKSQSLFPDAFAEATKPTAKAKVTPVSSQYGVGETDVPVGPPLGETVQINFGEVGSGKQTPDSMLDPFASIFGQKPSTIKKQGGVDVPLIPGVAGFLGGLGMFAQQPQAKEPVLDPFGQIEYIPLEGYFTPPTKARQSALNLEPVILKQTTVKGKDVIIPPKGTPTIDIKTITGLPEISTRTFIDPLSGGLGEEKTTTTSKKTTTSKIIPLGGIGTSTDVYTQKGRSLITPDFSDPLQSAFRGPAESIYNELVGVKDIYQQVYDYGRGAAGKAPVFKPETYFATPQQIGYQGAIEAAAIQGQDIGGSIFDLGRIVSGKAPVAVPQGLEKSRAVLESAGTRAVRTVEADPIYGGTALATEIGSYLIPFSWPKKILKGIEIGGAFVGGLVKGITKVEKIIPVGAKTISKGKPTKAGIGEIIAPSGRAPSIPLTSALREETGSLPGVSTAFERSTADVKAETVAAHRQSFENALKKKGGLSEAEAQQIAQEATEKQIATQKLRDALVAKSKALRAEQDKAVAESFFETSGKRGPAQGIPENIRRGMSPDLSNLDFSPGITSRFGTKELPSLPGYEQAADATFRESLGLGIKVAKKEPFTIYEEATAKTIQAERAEKLLKAKAVRQEGVTTYAPDAFNEYLFGGPAGKIGGIVKGEDIMRFGDDFTGFGETAASKTKPRPPSTRPAPSTVRTVTKEQTQNLAKRAGISEDDAKTILDKQAKRAEQTGDDYGYRQLTTEEGLGQVQIYAEEAATKSAKLRKLEKAAQDLAEQKDEFKISSIADQKTQRQLSKLIKDEKLLSPEKATQKALRNLIKEEKIKKGIKSLDETPISKRFGEGEDLFRFGDEAPIPKSKGRIKIGAAAGIATGALLGGLLYTEQKPVEAVTTGYGEKYSDPLLDIQSNVFQEQTKTKQTGKQKTTTGQVQDYNFGYGQQQGQTKKTTGRITNQESVLDIFQQQKTRQTQETRQEEIYNYRFGGGGFGFGAGDERSEPSGSARRFFRVFEVAKTPFGTIERGLGTQVQSSAPIFEISDILGQPKQKGTKKKSQDIFSMDF